jgi:hypothetical protein
MTKPVSTSVLISVLTVGSIVLLAALFWGLPVWNVWKSGLSGEAELRRAEQEKMIMIEQARAEKESAVLRAEAIQIIGQATKDFPEYRQQEFIGAFANAIQDGSIHQIIYVPTEANIPITEAGKRN